MRRTRIVAAALLAASLALAGCGASDDARSAADSKGLAAQKPVDEGAEGAEGAAGAPREGAGDTASGPEKPAGSKTPAVARQHVIRTAELYVEVASAPKALLTTRDVVVRAGGHVSNETTERIDDSHVTSRVVLRVPQEQYDSVLGRLAGAGKLISRKADAKDVTEQVVDVDSRITTQRASVERVRKLMDKATQLSDVVTLEGELSRRQADLESLLAQQASLKDRTTMATITLELTERETPKQPEDDTPGLLEALDGGWSALVTSLTWLAIVLAALAPWLAVLLALYAAWRWLLRPRLSKRTPTRTPTPGPTPVPAPRPDGASAAPAPKED